MALPDILELALKAVGVIAGGIVALLQARNLLPANRRRLKADLEVLRLIDPANPLYSQVKANVDRQLERVYPDVRWPRPRLVYSWTELIWGVVYSVGFAAWTIYLDRDGFSWWSPVTGFVAFSGMVSIVRSFDGSRFYQDIAAVVKSDLRNLITAQESYFADNVRYAIAMEKLSYAASRHVTVRLTHVTPISWAGAAKHEPSGLEYGIYVGAPPPELAHHVEGSPFPIAAPKKLRQPAA